MNNKKKIIIIGPAYPYRGGNSLFVSSLYDALTLKFDTKIFNYKLLYPSLLFPGTTQYDVSNEAVKKVPCERLINSINPFNWINVAVRINKENPDLIVIDWWHPFFAPCHFFITQLLKKQLKKRILFITENFISHDEGRTEFILSKLGLKNANSFLTLSKKVVKEIKPLLKGRKVYQSELPIYNCYPVPSEKNTNEIKKEFGFKKDEIILLFFGYIRKYKGLDILIDAFKIISNKHNNVKLLIAGESYDDINIYINQINNLGLAEKIKLENKYIANEEVYKYYSTADLVILPYRSGTQSGILNIAYGFLKPVLVTNVGGLTESIDAGKTGIIVQPDSAEEIAKGVDKFLELKQKINFTENINSKLAENAFSNISNLFNQIIEEIN
jgi:glycosyltransferase involved in cell wall biosynthesis